MARRATCIDSLRALDAPLVVVDGGDFSAWDGALAKEKTDFQLAELAGMGYDAMVPGPFDLERVSEEGSTARPPIVLSNSTAIATAEPFRVLERGGWRVGIFALSDVPDQEDPFVAAARTLAEFDESRADLVILLSQLEQAVVDSLLDRYPEIDVAVMGHRTTRSPGRKASGAIRVHPHPKGRALMVAEITRSDIESTEVERLLLDRRIPADPEVAARVQDMVAKINAEDLRRRTGSAGPSAP